MECLILFISGIFIGWTARMLYSVAWYYIDKRKARAEEHEKFKNRYNTYLYWISDKSVMK